MAGVLLCLEFSSPGCETTTYMEMQDAHQPHFLMQQVANAMVDHASKWGPSYTRAFFVDASDQSLKELTEESVDAALTPLLSQELPELKVQLRPGAGAASSSGSQPVLLATPPTAVPEPVRAEEPPAVETEMEEEPEEKTAVAGPRFDILTTEIQSGDLELEFEMLLEDAKSQPKEYVNRVQAYATHLAGGADCRMTYKDDDGDLCTLIDVTSADAIAHAKALEDDDLQHRLTIFLQLLNTAQEDAASDYAAAAFDTAPMPTAPTEPTEPTTPTTPSTPALPTLLVDDEATIQQPHPEPETSYVQETVEIVDDYDSTPSPAVSEVGQCMEIPFIPAPAPPRVEDPWMMKLEAQHQKEREDWQVEFGVLKAGCASLESELEEMKDSYTAKCAQCADAEDLVMALKRELAATQEKLAFSQEEAGTLRAEVEILRQAAQAESDANTRLTKRMEVFNRDIVDLEESLQKEEGRSQNLQSSLIQVQMAYQQERERGAAARKELATLKQTVGKTDPGFAAQVIKSQPDSVGVDLLGAADARSGADITAVNRGLKDSIGATQVFRMGFLKAHSFGEELPVIYTVRLQNTGKKSWPATAAMVHHSGPMMDLPMLHLTELQSGACCDLFVELTIPKVTTAQTVISTWVVRDVSTGQALGPILTMEVEFQAPQVLAFDAETPAVEEDEDEDEDEEGQADQAAVSDGEWELA